MRGELNNTRDIPRKRRDMPSSTLGYLEIEQQPKEGTHFWPALINWGKKWFCGGTCRRPQLEQDLGREERKLYARMFFEVLVSSETFPSIGKEHQLCSKN